MTSPRPTSTTDGRVPRCWSSGGARPTGPSPPGCSGSGPGATRWPRPTSSTSTRSRPTSGEVLRRYRRVLVPEVNLGQLSRLLRAEYLVDAISFTQVQGIPFRAAAMEAAILQQIDGRRDRPTPRDLARSPSNGHGTAPPTGPPPPERCPTDDRPGQRRRDLGPRPAHHPQGLVLRPGGPVVPGMRRLLDPGRGADAHARPRGAPGEHRLPVRHRLRGPVPVLHEHLRDALHPRPGAGHRHRAGHHPARPRRLGGHR